MDQSDEAAHRDGVNSLLKDIETGTISVILTEDLDRLSRSQSDIAVIFSLAEYHGVEIRTVFDGGKISDLHVGMKGTMSAIELKKISERTRRGQIGSVKAGKVAGGLPYGYAVNPYNKKGEIEAGHRKIVPAHAAVIKRIYDDYLAGKSANQIVRELNNEGIPGPRNGQWNASTITGHWGRINGILQNPIYKGVILWNRNNWDKHPSTGKRVCRPNSSEHWVETSAPHLQIISTALWNAVQKRRASMRRQIKKKQEPIPKFNFVILCSACSGKMVPVCQTYLRCYNARRKGSCNHTRKVRQDKLVDKLFKIVRGFTTKNGRQSLERQLAAVLVRAKPKIAEIDYEIATLKSQSDNLLDAIASGLNAGELVNERLNKINDSINELKASRASFATLPQVKSLNLERLDQAIHDADKQAEQRMLIDTVIGSVQIGYDDDDELKLSHVEPDLRAISDI
jgi:site-specific DNA recombinase